MKIYPFSKLILIILFSMLVMIPVSAQQTAESEDLETIGISFTGHISFDEEGNVYIDGYFLAPAGAISPSALSEGQYVEVTGIFLNDDTFKLTEIDVTVVEPFDSGEEVDENTEDVGDTTDETGDDTTDEMGDPTDDTGDDTTCDPATDDTCVPEEETCTPDGHPVAARIADAFDVDACDVEALHDEGNGFGNIARAYLLAEAANQALLDGLAEGEELDPLLLLDAQAFIDMHDSGIGWGQIVKESGVHPSDLAPGKLKKRAANDDDTGDEAYTSTSESNSNNGNSNANANNGNANKDKDKSNNGNANKNKDKSNNGNANKDKDKSNNGKKK